MQLKSDPTGGSMSNAAAAAFPSKSWAGRLGPWTPALQWAPEQAQQLVEYRRIQLDAWLVHVVSLYNAGVLPPVVEHAVYEFLTHTPRPPCQQTNTMDLVVPADSPNSNKKNQWLATAEQSWQWNNPFRFTLGSSFRQAAQTVELMCCRNSATQQQQQQPPKPQNSSSTSSAGLLGLGSSISRLTGVASTVAMVGRGMLQLAKQTTTDADQSIPLDLLRAAQGLAFLTVIKGGLIVSGRIGTGLVVARLSSSSSNNDNHLPQWSAPCALGTLGLGWGAQMGGDVTHYLIVLTTQKAVRDLVCSGTSVTLGAELGMAVGPLGRGATTALQSGDWTLHSAYSYAHSQGLYMGVSLEGAVVKPRHDVNATFYGQNIPPETLLQQPGPTAAQPLYRALAQALQVQLPETTYRPSQHLYVRMKSQQQQQQQPQQNQRTHNYDHRNHMLPSQNIIVEQNHGGAGAGVFYAGASSPTVVHSSMTAATPNLQ